MPMLPLLRSLLLSKQKMTVKNGLARCQLIFFVSRGHGSSLRANIGWRLRQGTSWKLTANFLEIRDTF